MKTPHLIIVLFFVLALIIATVFQYFKIEAEEIAQLTETTEVALRLKQQDIGLNESALKAASFKLVHFDNIVIAVKRLKDTQKELNRLVSVISDDNDLSLIELGEDIDQSINTQISEVEQLKGRVALARNSSNFLLGTIGKQTPKSNLASSKLALRALNELQGYQIFQTPERKKKTIGIIKLLAEETRKSGDKSEDLIILRHMQASFQATQEIEKLQKRMLASDSQALLDKMLTKLGKLQKLRLNRSGGYRYILLGLAIIIFIALSYSLIRWSQARQKSERTTKLFREAVEAMPEGFAFFGHDYKLAFWNSKFESLHRAMGDRLKKGINFEDFETAQKEVGFLVSREKQEDGSFIDQTSDGRWILSSNTIMAEGGHSLIRVDLTAQKKAQDDLHLAATVFQTASEAMMVTNAENEIQMVNAAFTRITGYAEFEILGKDPSILSSGRHAAAYYQQMFDDLQDKGTWQGEIWNKRKNGEIFPEWLSITTIYDDDKNVLQRVSLFSDITNRKKFEERIHYQANYDALTDLPNRNLFRDRLSQSINMASRHKQRVAILFLDIDNFKHINDTLGHQIGDELLRHVADRLRSLFRTSDTIARISGDEFTIILNDAATDAELEHLLSRILECLSLPYVIDGNTTYTSVSIGATYYPDDGKTVDSLLQNADAAMFKAKDLGRNTYCFFTPEMNSRAQERHKLEVAMHKALENGDFILHYQPMIDPLTQKVVSTEALVRWDDPKQGLISPGRFIPVAEDTGLIVPLGEWILMKACQDCAQWNRKNDLPIGVSVNLSSRQFQRSDIVGLVRDTLAKTGLPPEKLTLEITESLLVDDDLSVLETLKRIRDLGVLLSIDDFGTGYSSLSYLKKFPITTLKIDRSFIMDVLNDPEDAALTQAILSMAQSLNLKVVAEGVEDAGQVAFLLQRKCDLIQGFYYSKPLPLGDLLDSFENKTLKV